MTTASRRRLRRFTQREALVAAVAGVVAAVMIVLYWLSALANLERASVDTRFSIRGPQSPGDGIAIIAIDQKTLTALNVQPPIARAAYAQVLDRIHPASPRLIAIDTQFIGRSHPPDDQMLLDAIARDGPVILATHEGDQGPIPVPAGVVNARGAIPASAAVDTDPDGVLRKMMFAPVQLPTLPVRAAELLSGHSVQPFTHKWIDYRGGPGTFPHYSFVDVMAGTVPASAFAGKAVLIGTTDPVNDVFVTPISSAPMAGVEVQANALWTLLAGVPLNSAAPPVDIALVLLVIAIPALIGARNGALYSFGAALGTVLLFLVGAQLAFNAGLIVSVAYPLMGLATATAGVIAVDSFMERRQRQALERALGDLLPPQTPPAFFLSYRRSQSAWHARDIKRELVNRFGASSVFMDKSSIEYGETFPARIAEAIRGCSAMLVLIGPNWLEQVDGRRRIDDPNDWVRREVEAGLQRSEAVVVPTLVDEATSPSAAELPESIAALATLHAVQLCGDDLEAEIDKLVQSIQRGRRRTNGEAKQTAVRTDGDAMGG
ncbi:CHASE2 domain-containing protein [Mycobacterium sp. OAE908]|uniref:CHASE2 domain-containing protein n=1 Tax=Mycobacterium sp. OAE908 TaxID=2817899 RepID=UPI001AE698AD